MVVKMDLVYDYLEKHLTFSKDEFECIRGIRETETIIEDDFEQEHSRLLSFLPNDSLKSFQLTVDTCATNIIDKLFEKYVDDDTLVITTGSEHHSVRNNLNKCKHVLQYVCHGKPREDIDLLNAIKPFKKIFVYMIALSVGDPHYLHNDVIMSIQRVLTLKGKDYITVLDAVQELFMLPRDYSLYDYVVGTSHALIPKYNMGMLFGKENICYKAGNWVKDFNDKMEILMKRRGSLYLLNNVLKQHFAKFMLYDDSLVDTSQVPYVFNLADYKKRLANLNDFDVEKGAVIPDTYTPVTFRACPFAVLPEKFLERIQIIDCILSENE